STADGKQLARWTVPERGKVLRFTSDNRLLLGTFRGSIFCYNLDGSLKWQYRVADGNDILGQDLPLYDPAFPDHTDKLWPTSRDEPGDLDKLVRMDANRLTNADGWKGQGGSAEYHNEGYQSNRSIKVGDKLVSQETTGFLGQHATWVLDFHYRSLNAG